MKAKNWKITQKFLDYKTPKNPDFKKPKWVEFCENFINYQGVTITLYEAPKTSSKYITILFKKNSYKVRFSDHKPIKKREQNQDCDFFVGVTNYGVTNTDMAILATLDWLEKIDV